MVFALMCLTFLCAMLFMLQDDGKWMVKCGVAAILLNLGLLFGGIFGDPGVKPATYLHYTKNWFSGGKELFGSDDEEEVEETQAEQADEESVSS